MMPSLGMVRSVIREYGLQWIVCRSLYGLKLRSMCLLPFLSGLYERKPDYPQRIDLFWVDPAELGKVFEYLDEADRKDLIYKADCACEGRIHGFSSIELNYGNPIDWQFNPVTGKSCKENAQWYTIADFDNERGDIKVIWEISRFSHFITLARAYLLTKDIKYYDCFSSQLKDWLEKNRYNCGANYKCGQECSIRMVNTLLAYSLFSAAGVSNDADTSNVKDLVDRCYRRVISNFFYAYKCIKNNHTISEIMGLIVGAWCCNDQKRLDRAYSILEDVLLDQFSADGGYCQYSFNYQRLAMQDLECVLSISGITGRNLSKESRDRIKNSALLMYQCQDESGDMPNYGNNDGALIFPVSSCGYRDFSPVINSVYAILTGNQLYLPGKHLEELIWFSAGKKVNEFGEDRIGRVSSRFVDAGLFTIRGRNSWAMTVCNDYCHRPSHMDQNHFDLWIDGINVLCDTGTFSYTEEEGRLLAENPSHNTVTVENGLQMNSRGPFLIYDRTTRYLGECNNDEYEGKVISVNGYSHVRRVRYTDGSYEITDTVDKNCLIRFHTVCDVDVNRNEADLTYKGKLLCRISCDVILDKSDAVRSLYYLNKDKITCISAAGEAGKSIKTIVKVYGDNQNG